VALDISDLIVPARTAVVINECQQGVLGEHSVLPDLADATRWIVPNVARLVLGARQHGAAVIHTVAAPRPDHRGGATGRMISRHVNAGEPSPVDPQFSAIMPEVEVAESDFIVPRLGGFGGFSGSGVVSILRALGVSTVILGGVSLNAGVFSMMVYAIDEGFDPVVVSDAASGYPREYGEEVLRRSVRPFAPIVTVQQILDTWAAGASA
jgi:biuret amidohydrolase